MDQFVYKAINNLKFKKRVAFYNGWIFGPVFIANLVFLTIGICQSSLGESVQSQGIFRSSYQALLILFQSLDHTSISTVLSAF